MNFVAVICALAFVGMANSLPRGFSYDQGRSAPGTEFSGLALGQGYESDQGGWSSRGNQGYGSFNQGQGAPNQGFAPGRQGSGNGQGFNRRKGYQDMGY